MWAFDTANSKFLGLISERYRSVRRKLRYATPRYFRYLSQTVVVTPLIMGVLSAYLFAFVPQMQEIYLSLIDEHDASRGLAGLAVICLFSALLYSWNHMRVSKRIDAIYPDHADIYFDRGVIDVRDLKTLFVSSLPFLGLLLGLIVAGSHLLEAQRLVEGVENVTKGLPGQLPRHDELNRQLVDLHDKLWLSGLVLLCTYLGMVVLFSISRRRRNLHRRILHFCYALSAFVILMPVLFADQVLHASQRIGPLASTGFVLIAGAVLMRLVFLVLEAALRVVLTLPSAALMSAEFIPIGVLQLLVVLVPISIAGYVGYLQIPGHPSAANGEGTAARPAHKGPVSTLEILKARKSAADKNEQISEAFAKWLEARHAGDGYPVYIIAAEGGGIYAATAISFFLAAMQDHCPAFVQHVFAISGVSGGSIGTSLFDAALAAEQPKSRDGAPRNLEAAPCPQLNDLNFEKAGEFETKLRDVTLDDHLSPVLAYLIPDVIKGFVRSAGGGEPCDTRWVWLGRDQILEKSFDESFGKHVARGHPREDRACEKDPEPVELLDRFSTFWDPAGNVPAPLLNATWVETGYRVAFSPFSLTSIGHMTLYSFGDVERIAKTMESEGQQPAGTLPADEQNPSLIKAAVVSARFPVIMPPWIPGLKAGNRWSFVDGGYADSSGATTALELYAKLKQSTGETGGLPLEAEPQDQKNRTTPKVDLNLIVLTDAFVEPDFKKINATWLDDFVAPVNTLLTVRQLLARRAITDAYDAIGDHLSVIQLDQKSYALPLGWKISRFSSDIIRFTLGTPASCDGKLDKHSTDWPVWSVDSNSCQLKKLLCLLKSPRSECHPEEQAETASR